MPIMLALENNFDIAIARYNLDISDTDILRSRAGGVAAWLSGWTRDRYHGGSSSTLDLWRRTGRHVGGRVRRRRGCKRPSVNDQWTRSSADDF